MKWLIFLFITLLFFTTETCAQNQIVPPETIEFDEYIIYKVLLEELFVISNTKQLAISKSTSVEGVNPSEQSSYIKRKLPQTKPKTVESFNSRNQKPFELTNNFGIQPKIIFVTEEDLRPLNELPRDDLGEAFKAAFKQKFQSENLISFSRVGFSKDKKQALVFVSYVCGFTCGEGKYVLLAKKSGNWVIKKQLRVWIS